MYGNGMNGNVNAAVLAGDPNAIDNLPGMQLTEEQKEISRKDREKLAQTLQYVMIAQIVGLVANIAVGAAGISFWDSEEGPPYSVGNFICAGVLGFSLFGAYNLRNMAQKFDPKMKSEACCFLILFEIPNIFILTGSFLIIIFSTTSNTFSDKCDDDSITSSFDCTSNPDADEYKTVAIFAIILVIVNLGLAIAAGAVMCTSQKAFATNQVAFNRPLVQTRQRGHQTMMVQQQLILQQQLAMQQQMQGQQMGIQPAPHMRPPPPNYDQSVYPPPPSMY